MTLGRFALDPGCRRIERGAVLVGGTPLRLLRLSPAGARIVDRLAAGEPLPDMPAVARLVERLVDAGLAHPRPDAGAGPALDQVAVVVPVRDRPGEVDALLAEIPPEAEVVVVDDGSRVPVRARRGATIRHDVGRGPAAARNTGWRATSRPIVVFLDSDVTPRPGWLEPLLAHLGDDRVVAAAPRVASAPGPSALARYELHHSPLDLGHHEAAVRPRGRVSYVPTAALAVRRSALEAVGGFDEALHVGEDVDLVWRLVAAGGRVRYVPSAVVSHPPRPDLASWLAQRYRYGTSAGPLGRRHPGALAPVSVSPWSALAWTLAALGRPAAGVAVGAGTTALLVPRLRPLRRPVLEAARLAGAGHVAAGGQLAEAVVRVWWPLALVASVVSRRARRALLASAVAPVLIEWARTRPALDPARWLALRLADHVAYGAGVWAGAVRARVAAPLVPDLPSWPGRRQAVERADVTAGPPGGPPARRP